MSDIYGFLVGIERYAQSSAWNLPGPCANAMAIAQWLLDIGVQGGNVFLFLDPLERQNQKISVLEAAGVRVRRDAEFGTIDTFCRTELSRERPAGSRLLVYWSGHGFTENDGTRVFICSDYTADRLNNRVFNGSSFCRHLHRSTDFQCFEEQIFLAEVCASYSGLNFEANKSSPQHVVNAARQVAYFATPEGEYARGENGIGAFTQIAIEVFSKLSHWPNLEKFSQGMDDAFQKSSQKPFRVDEADEFHNRPNRLVGSVAPDSGNTLFQSLWSVLSPIDLPDTTYRPHYLRTVNRLLMPELVAAQGLSGMIRELTSLCDTAGTGQAPDALLEFLVRLGDEANLRDVVSAWLSENAADQQHALANARERIQLESAEKILVVEVRNDATGAVTAFEPSLRHQNLKPVPEIRLPLSLVRGWDAFRSQFPSVVETLRNTHDVWDFQIHFLVDPPLFNMPFHQITIDGSTLGEEFVVLVRYRDRLRRPSSAVQRSWRQYADALRASKPSEVQLLPIPDPGNGPVELDTKNKGLCYSRFAVAPTADSNPEKNTLMRLLRLGAAYLFWSHELPQANDWKQVESCLSGCLAAVSTLDWFPSELKNKRLAGNAIAQQSTLLWDDPEFTPFPIARGTQVR